MDITDQKVSIILPIIREEGAKKCIEAISMNAGIPSENFELIAGLDTKRIGCPKMVKILAEKSNYDLVMFLADDTIPQKDFLKNALKAMATLPDGWGLVALDDGLQNPGLLATHWLASKKLLPLIGGEFFCTEYKHNFCDQELTMRCKDLGRFTIAYDSVVKHNHPAANRMFFDRNYLESSSEKSIMDDRNVFDRRLKEYLKAKNVWNLKKIPKILHLYWGRNKKLSFMKFLTPYSFAKLNPDWRIVVHYQEYPNADEADVGSEQKSYSYKHEDWFYRLIEIDNLELRMAEFDQDKYDIEKVPELFRNDLYRIQIMQSIGGFWSDFDVLFVRPMYHLDINKPENENTDTVTCSHYSMNKTAFLGGAPGEPNFYSGLYNIYNKYRKRGIDVVERQAYGESMFNDYFAYTEINKKAIKADIGVDVSNIAMSVIYPVLKNKVEHLYGKDFKIRNDTIGFHWYSGDPKTSKYENEINEDNISAFDDKMIFSIMKSIYLSEKFRYSILMPYYKRHEQLHNTLVSFTYHYEDRNDYEVVIVEDGKNYKDADEHEKLLSVISGFSDKVNIKHIVAENIISNNPSPYYNIAAENAEGKILVITSPECLHENNVLDRFDGVMGFNDSIYAICACRNVGLYPKMIEKFEDFDYTHLEWYQHSKFRNMSFHFCSAISKYNYQLIGGFDDRFSHGIDYDDVDFREMIKSAKIEIVKLDDAYTLHQKHSKDPDIFTEEKGEDEERNRQLFYTKRKKDFRLGIGLPHTDKTVTSYFFDSWVTMEKPDFVYMRPPYTGYIGLDKARNALVLDAFTGGCTHLLMMDTDQIYPTDTIPKLLSHGKAVVGGVVHRRYAPFDPILYKGTIGNYSHIPDELAYSGELVEVDATGCGCILYDMEVFKKVQPPWFEIYQLETGKDVGEDIGFCAKLRDAGFSIYVDTSIEIEHMSVMGVTRTMYEWYKKVHHFGWADKGA